MANKIELKVGSGEDEIPKESRLWLSWGLFYDGVVKRGMDALREAEIGTWDKGNLSLSDLFAGQMRTVA